MPRLPREATTVTFTGDQVATIVILLVLATAALFCVALYSSTQWSWEKRDNRLE